AYNTTIPKTIHTRLPEGHPPPRPTAGQGGGDARGTPSIGELSSGVEFQVDDCGTVVRIFTKRIS
ncbi:MAG: hypothetical protein WCJ35_28925, partial [Planctomycetota bacterium]